MPGNKKTGAVIKKICFPSVFLLFCSTAFAHTYPADIPKNFKSAPEKTICKQNAAPHIYKEEYKNPMEGWVVIIEGRGNKDVYTIIFPAKRRDGQISTVVPKSWWLTERGWKMHDELWNKERIETDKFSTLFNETVLKFLKGCIKN